MQVRYGAKAFRPDYQRPKQDVGHIEKLGSSRSVSQFGIVVTEHALSYLIYLILNIYRFTNIPRQCNFRSNQELLKKPAQFTYPSAQLV